MFSWSNSSVSLADTARQNTQNYVETRKKTIDLLADRLFTTVVKDIIKYSSENSVSNMVFSITDPLMYKKVNGLSDATHFERSNILEMVMHKLQDEKFECQHNGTVFTVSWELKKPAQLVFFYKDGCGDCEIVRNAWLRARTTLDSANLIEINESDFAYKTHKPVKVTPTVRFYPNGIYDAGNFVETEGVDNIVSVITEFVSSN